MSKQYEKVLSVLLSSPNNEVTKQVLETTLANDIQVYRLSTYIWDLKKKLGGNVQVIKNGKNISGYKLLNPDKFKNFGKEKEAEKVQQVKAAAAKKAVGKKTSKKVPVEGVAAGGEVPSFSVDPGFDNFSVDDVMKGL